MGCDGFGLYPFVVLMLGSGVALVGNGAGGGASGITGNGVAAHARDPAERLRQLHRDQIKSANKIRCQQKKQICLCGSKFHISHFRKFCKVTG